MVGWFLIIFLILEGTLLSFASGRCRSMLSLIPAVKSFSAGDFSGVFSRLPTFFAKSYAPFGQPKGRLGSWLGGIFDSTQDS